MVQKKGRDRARQSLSDYFIGLIKSRKSKSGDIRPPEASKSDSWKLSDMSPLQTHDIVTSGLPVVLVLDLIKTFNVVDREAVLLTIGVSEKTLQRWKSAEQRLDTNASDRLIRLAVVTEQAMDVFGSRDAAESWLVASAIGLDGRRPLDLLQTSEGVKIVKLFLTRIDYGTYT